jgi:type I restriction enzyme R subunit
MNPEEKARLQIDRMLEAAGWSVQALRTMELGASAGVAVREYPLATGRADYVLFVDRRAIGVVKAQAAGTTLGGTTEPSAPHLAGDPARLPLSQEPLPFNYESTGSDTFFRDLGDPHPRWRRVLTFHRPETLLDWYMQGESLRARLRCLPPLVETGLRDCQAKAIRNLELSFREAHPRALIQMATGSGKTRTAIGAIYRLIKYANAKRILFLVDRRTLGAQALAEFQQYVTPDDKRKFTELYPVEHLTSNTFDPATRVAITTIQRLYSMLRGEPKFDPADEDVSAFEIRHSPFAIQNSKFKRAYPAPGPANGEWRIPDYPFPVTYNPHLPIETFDFIIADECHPSIYHRWRQVLEYFDAFFVGLTALPSKQTLGFFNQNLVMQYGHERAVADAVSVGYDVYRIRTEITAEGSKVEAGFLVDKWERQTRRTCWEQLDEESECAPNPRGRDLIASDQVRAVIRTFKERLFTEIFPGRREVPKTLIFAKDDSHAQDIAQVVREEFGRGSDFCEKLSPKSTGDSPESLIASFRGSFNPRIAVTVDAVSTGTDIRPLECLLFLRDVHSSLYLEQMKGRGTRTISPAELNAVTPDAKAKSHFVIVDAVGVCENDKTDSHPLERKPAVPFEKLLQAVTLGMRDEDTLTSLAGRLARLDREIGEKERREIANAVGAEYTQPLQDGILPPPPERLRPVDVKRVQPAGVEYLQPLQNEHIQPLRVMVNRLLSAVDPDSHIDAAREMFETPAPTGAQVRQAAEALTREACEVFDQARVRDTLTGIWRHRKRVMNAIGRVSFNS